MKISLFIKPYITKVFSFLLIISIMMGTPLTISAGSFDTVMTIFGIDKAQANDDSINNNNNSIHNSQNMDLFMSESSVNPDFINKNEPEDIILVQDDSFIATEYPYIPDVKTEKSSLSDDIRVYTVEKGDTISEIAETFGVSTNTIRWENNISKDKISVGQKLNILPVTGVKHIIKKGDTISSIANKYEAETEDILIYNDILKEDILKQGDLIFIPNGIIKIVVSKSTSTVSSSKTVVSNTKVQFGYYLRPVSGRVTSPYGPRSRGFHYGVDFGGVEGVTPVKAAADGVVTKVVNGCIKGRKNCGGGYGNYVDVIHGNGTTTRYAHLVRASVSVGQNVSQGQTVGILGDTGISTGPHLHFEIINANGSKMRPPF